ncbi:eCIS core domain-containing protein [Hyalangium gracile]|uniref:eCIS core domain-containing protein n=1 Tax=Hyalangium gracile TaxID=394092 RepID=UPI001CCE9847|nr:DUF4157 domain-containing protein [Hyalangium gracile]
MMTFQRKQPPQPARRATPEPAPGRPADKGRHNPLWHQLALSQGSHVQRSPSTAEVPPGREIPSIVQDTPRSGGGRPLDPTTRAYFEAMFQHPFEDVRVHTDTRASAAARSIHARAYTLGSHIVFRDPHRYDPSSTDGRRLLAHELTHVVQQRQGSAMPSGVSHPGDATEAEADRVSAALDSGSASSRPVEVRGAASATGSVQRASDFGEMYRGNDGKVRTRSQEYAAYKAALGTTKASSESGGHYIYEPLTRDELLKIFDGVAKDLSENKVPAATIDAYVDHLNQAFRVLRIDTAEAQASYIANAYVESDQFRFMTETEKAVKSNKPYQAVPQNVKLNTSWLDEAATGQVKFKGGVLKVDNYHTGGSINPKGDWQKSFIGRGPIQVTHRHNYVQVIAILENRAEELQKEDPGSKDLKDLLEAIEKIKADPREAANPKYGFLVSAAFMRMPDPTRNGLRGDEKANLGEVTSWMGPQVEGEKKKKAYKKAFEVLIAKYVDEQTAMENKGQLPSAAEEQARRDRGEDPFPYR